MHVYFLADLFTMPYFL